MYNLYGTAVRSGEASQRPDCRRERYAVSALYAGRVFPLHSERTGSQNQQQQSRFEGSSAVQLCGNSSHEKKKN